MSLRCSFSSPHVQVLFLKVLVWIGWPAGPADPHQHLALLRAPKARGPGQERFGELLKKFEMTRISQSLLLAGRSRHNVIGSEGFAKLAHEAHPAAAHDLVRELQQRESLHNSRHSVLSGLGNDQ